MKRLITVVLIASLLLMPTVKAVEINNAWFLNWLKIWLGQGAWSFDTIISSNATSDTFCLTDDTCITTWPAGGGGGAGMWTDEGTYIQPNTSFADNIFVPGYIKTHDWTNVSITEAQISDLAHTTNCSVTDSCSNIIYAEADPLWSANYSAYNDSWSYYETDTNISNCSSDSSCSLITYDSELSYTTDTNASTECSGTTTYLDGEGNCDDISGVYIDESDEGNLDVNSSDYWDDYSSPNTTQFENDGGFLHIITSWLTSFIDSWLGTKDTDNLAEGATNLYDNQSWNESLADTLYADISIASDNSTWNETHADSKYIQNDSHINVTSVYSTSNITADFIDAEMNWDNLTSFPSACPSGSAITQLDDSVTCTSFVQNETSVNFTFANVTGDLVVGGDATATNFNGTWYGNSTTYYLPRDGSLPMVGNLDLNDYNITNATYVNGVDFTNITASGTTVTWEIII